MSRFCIELHQREWPRFSGLQFCSKDQGLSGSSRAFRLDSVLLFKGSWVQVPTRIRV